MFTIQLSPGAMSQELCPMARRAG